MNQTSISMTTQAQAQTFRVMKRQGFLQELNPEKLRTVIRKCSENLEVDVEDLLDKTLRGVYDGITTQELYDVLIQNSSMLIGEDPAYSKLAARFLFWKIQDEVKSLEVHTFYDSIKYGYEKGILSQKLFTFVSEHRNELESFLDNKDLFEYFGLRTVYDRYLLKDPKSRKVFENPQYFYMRVACGLAHNPEEVKEFYHLMSSFEYMPSTPTLFNSGTTRSQMSSCYLLDSPEDSLDAIYDKYKDVAMLSKFAGGIGLAFHRVRSQGSLIQGTNGKSNGIIPFLKTLDASVAAVNQGGKRKGAACVYLETWHADIMDFLQLRENTGDEYRRTHNLNTANWIPDLFMQRVIENEMWSLFDPADVPNFPDLYGEEFEAAYIKAEEEKLYVNQLPAREIYAAMMKSLAQTGNGWMTFKDASNKKANQVGKDPKNIIHLSNLCVAPETEILTKVGFFPISKLRDKEVEVWNGEEWSCTTVKKTGENQKLIRVLTSDGLSLDCTEYHKFITHTGKVVRACELKQGTKLLKWQAPIIEEGESITSPYTQGFFSGDGCSYKGKNHIDLYNEKMDLHPHLDLISMHKVHGNKRRILISNNFVKFQVPLNGCLQDKLSWLAGYADADGTLANNGKNQQLQLCSVNIEFLTNVMKLLQTLGVRAKIRQMDRAGKKLMPDGRGGKAYYDCQDKYRILITSMDLQRLKNLGLTTHRLKIDDQLPNRDARRFVTVFKVVDQGRYDDTYCFTEPKRNMGVFNGILTGNCTEIIEVTSSNETAVCNLGSINLSKYVTEDKKVDYEKIALAAQKAIKYLDRVIDINFYPVETAEASNLKWRPVGLGIMGLQDLFFKLDLPFDSEEAKLISRKVQEEIYYNALLTSNKLAKENGAHKGFEETRASDGVLQFDLWGVEPTREGWQSLREDIKKYGLRNSLCIAIAPTATIASIVGSYEGNEAMLSNLFKRETLSGEFLQVNNYLVAKLKKLNLWTKSIRDKIKLADGSVQHIEEIPDDVKKLFRTVWEVPQKSLIDMAADRGAFIDQSQSLNLFIENPTIGKLSSMYKYAWKQGLKTTYYLRSRSATKIKKTTLSSYKPLEAVACSLENPETCEACQ